MSDYADSIWLGVAVLSVFAWLQLTKARTGERPRGGGIGSAAAGSIYDMLNQEKRNALEIIVEEKAAARDPEDKDGNLPDLENPIARKT